jgi:copper chaperone CopZ
VTIAETRIDVVSFACPGCDCGTCVTESIREIHRIPGVDHVRTDRRRTQIVVRHDSNHVSQEQLRDIVKARGIKLS